MTKHTENFKYGCKNKGNNLFLFTAGRRELTHVKKRKSIFLMVRKIRHLTNCSENLHEWRPSEMGQPQL